MSIFVAGLAFSDETLISEAKIGILLASLISGVVGYLVLRQVLPSRIRPAGSPRESEVAGT